MTTGNGKALSPEEGAEALASMVGEIPGLAALDDIAGFEAVFRSMEEIVDATNVRVSGFEERMAALRDLARSEEARRAACDAALWAGDFERARAFLEPDMSALDAFMAPEGSDADAPAERTDGETHDIALREMLGVSRSDAPVHDLYADLAAGHPGAAEAVIARGLDLNTPSGETGYTALLAALDAPGRRAETLALLIDAGADAGVLHGLCGDNAFSWAMGYDHPETIDEDSELQLFSVLVSEGADPDHVVPGQMAALHRGILQTSTASVEALLTIGADPDQTLPETFEPPKLAGATPIMLAGPKPDLLRRLLDHGADADALDARGRDQLAFLRAEARLARKMVDPRAPWTRLFARALEESEAILAAHREG